VNWEVAVGVARGLVNALVLGARVLALVASDEGWVKVASVLEMSDRALEEFLCISRRDAEEMRSTIQAFWEKAELVRPGEKYTWSGTLSLTMRVHVMNDKLQFDDRGCFTGPTTGSDKLYTISTHFKKLDVC
jgi:hypothetical protein